MGSKRGQNGAKRGHSILYHHQQSPPPPPHPHPQFEIAVFEINFFEVEIAVVEIKHFPREKS